MKDRLKYVIDSRYFDGTCLTSMSDGFHNDYGGETIEELRIRENNPYLKAVTPSDMDKSCGYTISPCPNRSRKSLKKNTMTCWMYCHPCA